jgi:tetratricopeptide (TPR) repeat protein
MMKPFIAILLILFMCYACQTEQDNNSADTNAKRFEAYIQMLGAQVAQHPDSIGLRLQLAAAYDSAGEFSKAFIQMDTLLAKDSANYGLWYNLGQIAEDAKDTVKAMFSYDKALRIYPSPDALLSLANLYAEQKNQNALILSQQVKDFGLGRETDAHAAFITGIYYARTGNIEKALASFDNCIANNYTYMEAYIEKGLVYFDAQQYQEALRIFVFASTINALDADTYYWQGRCYEMMHINDSAALRYKQSLNLSRNDSVVAAAIQRVEKK